MVTVDAVGRVTVGPRSAGAVPGPACYALGGTEPTVTDANVVLGYLSPAGLLGGAMPIDAERATRAIREHVAALLACGVAHAACGDPLATIVDEMAVTIVRTAHSALIREAMDFSTAICDAEGQIVAQSGASIPIHIGSVPDAMASILAAFRASVREGDTYLLNDPFDGGSHLPDIFVVKPLFCRGEHLGYAVTVAHHVDVGGRVPGRVAPDNTEIWQEGIRLGPVRLYDGGAAQVRGAINATASYTKSASYLALKTALSEEIPTNSGFFRPIEVTVPQGSILNVAPPGACGNRGLTGHRAMDAVFGALAKVLPGAVRAAGEGGTTTYAFAGRRADGRSFSVRESLLGAWGGGRDLDGVDAISSPAANIANTPAEVIEAEYPLAVDAYAFAPDSGGAGTHRGGLALMRVLRYCGERGSFYLRANRQRFRPYPLAGGCPGTPARVSLVRDGVERKLPAKVSAELRRGDVVRIVIPGAAGWGPPLNRDPQRVLEDVRSEKFSESYARRVYGVVFAEKRSGAVGPGALELDLEATRKLRRRRLRQRERRREQAERSTTR